MRHGNLVVLTAVLAAACGGSYGGGMGSSSGAPTTSTGAGAPLSPPATSSGGAAGGAGGNFAITIAGQTYSPANLTVPPGATITVENRDGMPHSVTSEAAPGAFTRGAVGGVSFDTGAFSSGSRTFTIPANTPEGTVIPFFCTVHLGTMNPPNGAITVTAAASPSTPAPTSNPATPPSPSPTMPGRTPGMPY